MCRCKSATWRCQPAPFTTDGWCKKKNVALFFFQLICSLLLFKCQNRKYSHCTLLYISIYVFIYIFVCFFLTYNVSPLFSRLRVLVGLFSKSISSNRNALDRCWKDSSLECTVADWINKAEPKGGREGRYWRGEGDVSELSLPTVQLIEMGLGFSFSL